MKTLGHRLSRLEGAGPNRKRLFAVRLYDGETPDMAFAAEHPGETLTSSDLLVVCITFSGLSRPDGGLGATVAIGVSE